MSARTIFIVQSQIMETSLDSLPLVVILISQAIQSLPMLLNVMTILVDHINAFAIILLIFRIL